MNRRCFHHAERPAHALCMKCRKALCQECAATWEGIHYCAACLLLMRKAGRTGVAWGGWIALALAVSGLAWLHARLLVWSGVLVAGWR
jgi:hypothetical protein